MPKIPKRKCVACGGTKVSSRGGQCIPCRGTGYKQRAAVAALKPKKAIGKVVHCKKSSYDVYIGRPSKWGNPFSIGKDGTRNQVIIKYRKWVMSQPKLLKSLSKLEGKVLGCWCYPKRCHGEVLLDLASKESK